MPARLLEKSTLSLALTATMPSLLFGFSGSRGVRSFNQTSSMMSPTELCDRIAIRISGVIHIEYSPSGLNRRRSPSLPETTLLKYRRSFCVNPPLKSFSISAVGTYGLTTGFPGCGVIITSGFPPLVRTRTSPCSVLRIDVRKDSMPSWPIWSNTVRSMSFPAMPPTRFGKRSS